MSSSFTLDNEKIKIPCPHCKKGIEVTIGQAKRSPQLLCRSCGTTVKLEASELKKGIDSVEKSLRDMQRKLGNLFKK